MSDDIATLRAELWQKMRTKQYRDTFVEAHFSTNVAAQIQTLREQRNWTQQELGSKAGMTQARISVLENPAYGKYNFSTLRRLASAFDVAFIGRFVAFSELVNWVANLSPAKLEAKNYEDDELVSAAPALPVAEALTLGKAPATPPQNRPLPAKPSTLPQNWPQSTSEIN